VNYQLDGADHNDSYLNANIPFPNPDALQEFNLQSSNFTAEYGNAAGGIVNVVTKSGTNQFHGTAFEFLRNGALNARNFFAPTQDTLKRNQFGGTFGGPVMRNRLFFFGTYQGTRIRTAPSGQISFVPTADERRGDFSSLTRTIVDPTTRQPFANNQVPAERLSPAAQFFSEWLPLPNGPGRQLTYPGSSIVQNENQFMPKIDYIAGKHQVNGSYFFTDWDQPPLIPQDNILAAASTANAVRVQNISVNHTYLWSPTLLLNSTFGFNRQRGGSLSTAPFGPPDAGVKIAGPGDSPLKAPPEIRVSVTGGFTAYTNHLGDFDRGSFTFREVVTKITGPHELKMGGEVVRVSNHITNTFSMAGQFTFSGQLTGDGMADFMIGRVGTFQQGAGEFKNQKGNKWSLFLQDDWRVNKSLTLNLGVRWDPFLTYLERDGRVACWAPGAQSRRYPNSPPGLIYGGSTPDPGCPANGADDNWGNIAPRFGFAYRVTQDGRTAIRGGVGYFYTPPETSRFIFGSIPPFAPLYVFNDVSFDDPYGSIGVQNPFPEQFRLTPPGPEATFTRPLALFATFNGPRGYRLPQVIAWNLIVERQFARDWVFRTSYHANKATYLSGGTLGTRGTVRDINPAIYIPGASTVGNTQARRILPDFSHIHRADPSNNSHFQSLQFNVEKRWSAGFSILANYTWGKTIDDIGWTNPFNRRFDYGISNDDLAHAFRFSNVWELPIRVRGGAGRILNGWSVNSIVHWQGGFPLNITSGRDNSFSGQNRDRADFLGGDADLGNSGRPHGEMVRQWFDTSKFRVNAEGTFGSAGRNILRGPRLFNTNLSLMKDTRLTERIAVQFRAEFFNLFNNVNFRNPTTNVSSGQFGQITQAGDPRILQFALKTRF
jgi:hypothetical protein